MRFKAVAALEVDHFRGTVGAEGLYQGITGTDDHGDRLTVLGLGTFCAVAHGFKRGFLELTVPGFGKNEDHA